MVNSETQKTSPPKIRRKVTYFEDREASEIERMELRVYLRKLMDKNIDCRIIESSRDQARLSVHYRNGDDVGCKNHVGYNNVKKEFRRLIKLVEENEDGTRL